MLNAECTVENMSNTTTHADPRDSTSSGMGLSALPSISSNAPSLTRRWNLPLHSDGTDFEAISWSVGLSLARCMTASYTPGWPNGAAPCTLMRGLPAPSPDTPAARARLYFCLYWRGRRRAPGRRAPAPPPPAPAAAAAPGWYLSKGAAAGP